MSLRRIDRAIHQLWRVARRVPEHQDDLYILADHGQTPCRPYRDVNRGQRFERWIFNQFLEPSPAWSEHQPSAERQDEFIRRHGLDEYGKWHLGIDEEEHEQTRGKYKFPYGDFENVHRCAVVSAESAAGQHKLQSIEYHGIESAAAPLHGMIDAIKR